MTITAEGVTTSFTIDALGRQASQTIGSDPTTTLAYLGTSDTVSSTAVQGVLSAYSAIDAIGDRVTTGLSSGFAYLLPDLHGNVVAAASSGSSPGYLSAYRYDAYGEIVASFTAGSGSVPVPYRYQGRRLQNDPAATDLYDFGARSYDPDLGAFTSFDTVSGSAQNPLTLNRYLYAAANPATLTDPDGHRAVTYTDGGSDGDIVPIASKKLFDSMPAEWQRKYAKEHGDECLKYLLNKPQSMVRNTGVYWTYLMYASDIEQRETGIVHLQEPAVNWFLSGDQIKAIASQQKAFTPEWFFWNTEWSKVIGVGDKPGHGENPIKPTYTAVMSDPLFRPQLDNAGGVSVIMSLAWKIAHPGQSLSRSDQEIINFKALAYYTTIPGDWAAQWVRDWYANPLQPQILHPK